LGGLIPPEKNPCGENFHRQLATGPKQKGRLTPTLKARSDLAK